MQHRLAFVILGILLVAGAGMMFWPGSNGEPPASAPLAEDPGYGTENGSRVGDQFMSLIDAATRSGCGLGRDVFPGLRRPAERPVDRAPLLPSDGIAT